MNRLVQSAAMLPLLAFAVPAQDSSVDVLKKKLAEEHMVTMNMVGAVKGPLVKGMPYSADEITETNQTLADGTRIHRENKVTVYRDSEGRTRRETPDSITISDPVANASYIVNPKTNAVRKLQMSSNYIYRTTSDVAGGSAGVAVGGKGEGATTFSMTTTGDGQARIIVNGKELDPKAVAELLAKAKAEGKAELDGKTVLFSPSTSSIVHEPMAGTMVSGPVMIRKRINAAGEDLGTKNMEGVIAQGKRNVETIEAGAIGNDRPIQVVNEHWFSEELGMMIYSKRSDPRTGEEVFRVTNIRRGDPPAYLFQAPAGAETKM
jgi:hypothetical protein